MILTKGTTLTRGTTLTWAAWVTVMKGATLTQGMTLTGVTSVTREMGIGSSNCCDERGNERNTVGRDNIFPFLLQKNPVGLGRTTSAGPIFCINKCNLDDDQTF
ncbi:hypothetical protein EDB19DRAFT_1768579, partial [Suillus lakei]